MNPISCSIRKWVALMTTSSVGADSVGLQSPWVTIAFLSPSMPNSDFRFSFSEGLATTEEMLRCKSNGTRGSCKTLCFDPCQGVSLVIGIGSLGLLSLKGCIEQWLRSLKPDCLGLNPGFGAHEQGKLNLTGLKITPTSWIRPAPKPC